MDERDNLKIGWEAVAKPGGEGGLWGLKPPPPPNPGQGKKMKVNAKMKKLTNENEKNI